MRSDEIIGRLRKAGTKATRDSMARYALPSDKAFGVTVGQLKKFAREIGQDHALAAALWKTGWYEARMLAAMIDEAELVTPRQMDRWSRDFDSWGICDTACFVLFDRAPKRWAMVPRWAARRPEFEKRTAFALLWSLSVHDKAAPDSAFLKGLDLIEQAATDERNFVKKSVNMALRAIGKRNPVLHAAAMKLSGKLASSEDPTARWIGKDALRELRTARVRGIGQRR